MCNKPTLPTTGCFGQQRLYTPSTNHDKYFVKYLLRSMSRANCGIINIHKMLSALLTWSLHLAQYIALLSCALITVSYERHGRSNHRHRDSLFNSVFRLTLKKTSKLLITGLLCGETIGYWPIYSLHSIEIYGHIDTSGKNPWHLQDVVDRHMYNCVWYTFTLMRHESLRMAYIILRQNNRIMRRHHRSMTSKSLMPTAPSCIDNYLYTMEQLARGTWMSCSYMLCATSLFGWGWRNKLCHVDYCGISFC